MAEAEVAGADDTLRPECGDRRGEIGLAGGDVDAVGADAAGDTGVVLDEGGDAALLGEGDELFRCRLERFGVGAFGRDDQDATSPPARAAARRPGSSRGEATRQRRQR